MQNQKLKKETHTLPQKVPYCSSPLSVPLKERGEKVPKTAGTDVDQLITLQYFANLAFIQFFYIFFFYISQQLIGWASNSRSKKPLNVTQILIHLLYDNMFKIKNSKSTQNIIKTGTIEASFKFHGLVQICSIRYLEEDFRIITCNV